MADHDPVGAVLGALADPTRRTIFEAVARHGPLTATSLAGDLPVSRQAVAKHLDRLADAGLVTADRVGRETQWAATPAPLQATQAWLADVGRSWEQRLDRLADLANRRHAVQNE